MSLRRNDDALIWDTEQFWARLSGFLFLWLIATGLGGSLLVVHVSGSGSFHEVGARIASSERLYRLGLVAELVETLSALLLAFSLYRLLRNTGLVLAQLALLWRVAEAILGCVGMIFGFARLRLYLSDSPARPDAATERLVDLTRYAGSASYSIGATCFAIGSGLFFWLFWRSRFLPKPVSAIGIAASALVVLICISGLIFPEQASTLQYGWAPMAVAEIGAGLWLLVFGAQGWRNAKTTTGP